MGIYAINMTMMKMQFISNITPKSFTVHLFKILPTWYRVIKMDMVSFTSKGGYVGFKNVNFHIVFNEPLLYQICWIATFSVFYDTKHI
jgi:hypothetical protein